MGSHDRTQAAFTANRSFSANARFGAPFPTGAPVGDTPVMRRYEIAGLTPDGRQVFLTRTMAAEPHVDEAFAAFARGTLIMTPNGAVAVEDLEPGMMLQTADAGPCRLNWVGSTLLAPSGANEHDQMQLTRITADSLGVGRPMPDLILGPRARMLFRHPGCRTLVGTDAAFAPASAFVDGIALIALRVLQPMRVYHLGLTGQHVLLANGVEVESYHPGENAAGLMDHAGRATFLSLFPHLDGFDGFGPMPLPRLTAFEMDGMRAA